MLSPQAGAGGHSGSAVDDDVHQLARASGKTAEDLGHATVEAANKCRPASRRRGEEGRRRRRRRVADDEGQGRTRARKLRSAAAPRRHGAQGRDAVGDRGVGRPPRKGGRTRRARRRRGPRRRSPVRAAAREVAPDAIGLRLRLSPGHSLEETADTMGPRAMKTSPRRSFPWSVGF